MEKPKLSWINWWNLSKVSTRLFESSSCSKKKCYAQQVNMISRIVLHNWTCTHLKSEVHTGGQARKNELLERKTLIFCAIGLVSGSQHHKM